MEKLKEIDGVYYTNDFKKSYKLNKVEKEIVSKCFDFAYDITFGKKGSINFNGRDTIDVFYDVLKGKIAELYIYNKLKLLGDICQDIDFKIYSDGEWDKYDIKIADKYVDVKTLKLNNEILLLDSSQIISAYLSWDFLITKKDYYIISKVSPDTTPNFLFKIDIENINKEDLKNIIIRLPFKCSVIGYLNKLDIQTAIYEDNVIKRDSLINSPNSKKINKDYIYIQSSDFRPIKNFVKELRQQVEEEKIYSHNIR